MLYKMLLAKISIKSTLFRVRYSTSLLSFYLLLFLTNPSAHAQQQGYCEVSVSSPQSFNVPFGEAVTINADLTANGDAISSSGAVVLDGTTTICNLAGDTSPSCSGTITPNSGTHTINWSCVTSGLEVSTATNFGSVQLTVGDGPSGTINPKFIVIGVVYAPPGQKSFVDYGSSTVFGTSSSLDNSFSDTNSIMVQVKAGTDKIPVLGGSITASTTDSYTQAGDTTTTVSVNKGSSLDLQLPGPANSDDGIDHDFDAFWLWVNPVVNLTQTGVNALQWSGYSFDPADPAGEVDVVGPVYVTWLKNPSTMPPGVADVLARTWAGSGQGLTTDDYATILARDPFANGSTNIDPTRFDLLGGQTFSYEPPPNGGQPSSQKFTLTYQATSQQGQTATDTHSVGFTLGVSSSFLGGLLTSTVMNTQTLVWTHKVAQQTTQTSGQTATLSLTGPSSGYQGPTDMQVYKDNVYGTFMFAFVPEPTFNLSAAPGSQTVVAGQSTSYTISTTSIDGFSGNVGFSNIVSGLPAGATAAFSPSSVGTPGSSTLTLTTSSSTPPGTYALTITANSTIDTRNIDVTLIVNPAGVTITAPTNNSTVNSPVLVTATATEPGIQISQMQVWDNTTGQKLGVINGSSVNQSFALASGSHQLVVEDLDSNFQLLHKATVNISVTTTEGVTITAPTDNSTVSSPVLITASATEPAGTQISQMQVWDNTTGQKLGVINGSSVNQSFPLAAGTHQLVVEDLDANFQLLHKATVNITVFAGVTITAPANNSTVSSPVLVTASATEPAGTQISQLQVWDNTTGQKLGVINGSSVNQTFALATGTHQLVVEDLDNNFQLLHKSTVNITVQ